MRVTWWPVLLRRLIDLVPTLDGWTGVKVYSAPVVTADRPASYAILGHVEGEDTAGSFERTADDITSMSRETGAIRGEIVCLTPAVDDASVRDRAFALAAALDDAIEADPRLGVLPPASTCSLGVDVDNVSTQSGSVARLIITVSYSVRS